MKQSTNTLYVLQNHRIYMEKSASNSAHEGKLEAADFSVAVDDCHRCNAMRCY